jgi:hypothetical protein
MIEKSVEADWQSTQRWKLEDAFPQLLPCGVEGRSYPIWPDPKARGIKARILELFELLRTTQRRT